MGMRVREDYRGITGPEKSAILLMSLGEEQAGKLFALLDDEEIKTRFEGWRRTKRP